MMNLNQLAKELTVHEAGKKQTNIAQTKDVLAALGAVFRELNFWDFLCLAKKIRDKAGIKSKG